MRSAARWAVALLLAGCSASDAGAAASVRLDGFATADLRQDRDQLCMDLGKHGGFCGNKLSVADPIVYGSASAGGPADPLYVFGVVLDSVESFGVKVGDQTLTPELVPVMDDAFWDVRAWVIIVEVPTHDPMADGATVEIVSVVEG